MAEVVAFKKRKPCPVCRRPSEVAHHPFCSNRCREVDLNRWLGGHYAIPAVDEDEESASNSPPDEI